MHNRELEEQLVKQLKGKSTEEIVDMFSEALEHLTNALDLVEDMYAEHSIPYYDSIGSSPYNEAEEYLNRFAE